MKTIQLPGQLITSLSELGLLESEAKIYAALVLLGYAEVKDLLELLDVSKPRIYDGLRMLEEQGLIVQTSPRPAMYQAIAPPIALEVLMKKHEAAKNEVLEQFRVLESREIIDKPAPPLCYLFGNKSFEFKIRDLLENARESICCQSSPKYLSYLEKAAGKSIKLQLVILSEDPGPQKRLERLFKKGNAEITTLTRNQIIGMTPQSAKEAHMRMAQADDLMDLDNLFMIIVDDTELLFIPPLKSDSLGAITSTNKGMVFMMQHMITERFKAGKPADGRQ
ncbi:MAG TPA: helix-turn-helix domain-containing protein [Methanocella sp.]|jgi:sugar-specific transcriptional regulator TrmB